MIDSTPNTKRCSKCGIPKPIDEFNLEPNHKDGHRSECKACKLLQTNAWRDKNKSKVDARKRITSKSEKALAQNRERVRRYKQRHPEKRRADNILYRARRKARPAE